MTTLFRRALRAAKLDPSVYTEVRDDPSATGQALTLIILQSLAGNAYFWERGAYLLSMVTICVGVASWLFDIWLIHLLSGIMGCGRNKKYRELLRPLGFAAVPGLLYGVSAWLPGHVMMIVSVMLNVWLAAAAVIAVRQGLRVGTGLAIAVYLISWLVTFLIMGGIFMGTMLIVQSLTGTTLV